MQRFKNCARVVPALVAACCFWTCVPGGIGPINGNANANANGNANANVNDNGNGNANANGNDNQAPRTVEVSMQGIAYVPNAITINVGDTVRWVNNDAVPHTVTSGNNSVKDADPLLNSGTVSAGASFEFTFNQPGTFTYYCEIHPTQMTNATVTVNAG